jgi:bifunctional non-homologous end joining protein LigD
LRPTPGTSNAGSAIIEGEVVVPAANGTTDFSVLQNELKGKSTKT